MRCLITVMIILAVSQVADAGKWVPAGTKLITKAFVLSPKEAKDMAINMKKIKTDMSNQIAAAKFYKDTGAEAKKIAKYYKERGDKFRDEWLKLENSRFKRKSNRWVGIALGIAMVYLGSKVAQNVR